jgi:hypothetical protein
MTIEEEAKKALEEDLHAQKVLRLKEYLSIKESYQESIKQLDKQIDKTIKAKTLREIGQVGMTVAGGTML